MYFGRISGERLQHTIHRRRERCKACAAFAFGHYMKDVSSGRRAHLLPPDEGSSNGDTNALHKVPQDMDDGPPQVDAVLLPAMAVAMAVPMPLMAVMALMIMRMLPRLHILQQPVRVNLLSHRDFTVAVCPCNCPVMAPRAMQGSCWV